MTYNSVELAKLTGYPTSSISKTLKRMGFQPLCIGDHNRQQWQEECLEALLQRKKNYDKEHDLVALPSLAHKYGISNQAVREILTNLNIQPSHHNHKGIEYYERNTDEIIGHQLSDSYVADESEHPLVKDKRWLERKNWPNIVPQCFEDLGDD